MTDWPHGDGEMCRRIRSHDWAATPLGPMERWPQSQRTAVELMLASGHAMQLVWGPEMTILYNDAYAPMLGNRHPGALGIPFRDAWPEIWDEIEPLVMRVYAGEMVKFEDMPLVMTRHGFREETWWNFSYSPVRDESGAVAGLLNVTMDATPRHRAERAERERDEANARLQENEARLRALATAGGNTVYRMSPDWQRMYELDSQTLSNTSGPLADWTSKYVLDEDRARVNIAIEQAIRNRSLFEMEHRVRLDDGSVGWVLSRAVPLRDPDSNVREWFGAASDITERKAAEQRLRESDDRQAFLLRLSDALRPIGDPAHIKSVATTLLGEHLGVNRAFYADAEGGQWHVSRGYEHDVESLPQRPFDMAEYGDWIIEGFKAGNRLVVDDMATDPRFSKSQRAAHLAIQIGAEVALPLVKNDRLVAMFVVHTSGPCNWSALTLSLLEDVAERTWAAVERARALEALRTADRRKDEVLAVLAHELRNGLAPLVYNMQIGNRSLSDPARLVKLFSSTDSQLQHLTHLVDDLLDVARVSTGKIDLSLEHVKARDVVNLALDASHVDIDRKRHRLTFIDEADFELAVHGDRVRLTQIVSNLLSNAAKYMDAGGTITVRLARVDDEALIEVSDTGIGIPAVALPRVFDLFTQVRSQQSYSGGGLGIGLSLVKQLVEMHGGRVIAASEGSGQGSRFTVRLPAAAAGAGELQAPEQAGASSEGSALRVLVVDDLREGADALAQLLRLEGHDAEAAYGGSQALESVRSRRPDLVLLDLGMPGMDGFEVARRLRKEFAGEPPMQIVALTGWGQEADRQQTKAADFDGHLTKPPSDAELQAVLSTARRSLG